MKAELSQAQPAMDAAAAAVDCDREPDPRNAQEYARWKRECEERQRPTRSKLSLAFSDADITRYHAIQS